MSKITSNEATCPDWCIEEHDNLNPIEHNIHMGEAHDLSHLFIPGVGEGTASASFSPIQMDSGAIVHLEVSVETELRLDELEACAAEFDRLASEIRSFAKVIEATHG